MLISLLAIIFVFGLIVLVHEWGHMIAAKLCGVEVTDFALGMFTSLYSFEWHGTRYHLCAVPIGGFVRIKGLEGEGSLEEMSTRGAGEGTRDPRWPSKSWQDATTLQRTFMLVAGPVMNIVLAFIVMLLMGLTGFPERTVLLNYVEPGSPAAQAGLAVGDEVLSVDGELIQSPQELIAIIQGNRDVQLEFVCRRDGVEYTTEATPAVIAGYNDGNVSLGISPMQHENITTTVSMVQPKTLGYNLPVLKPLAETGVQPGDQLIVINGTEVSAASELADYFGFAGHAASLGEYEDLLGGGPLLRELVISRGGTELQAVLPAEPELEELGLTLDGQLMVTSVAPDSLAAKLTLYEPAGGKGLKVGDAVRKLDSEPIDEGLDLMMAFANFDDQGKPVRFQLELDDAGEHVLDEAGYPVIVTEELTPLTGSAHVLEIDREGEQLAMLVPWNATAFNLGVVYQPVLERLPFVESMQRSLNDANQMMLSFLYMLKLMVSPEITKHVAGPAGIMSIIGQSAKSGWYTFMQIIVLINLNLALFNLLPIPALDGGRLVFVWLKGLGLKISDKRENMAHMVGMFLLLGFILLVTVTDVVSMIMRKFG